ncbi:MAG TPA: hypothetical protein ENJ19_00750 [Gammaproteobacteria bacterium]|nr:hypothetical protein [Gammaproteobacteria bacterium]
MNTAPDITSPAPRESRPAKRRVLLAAAGLALTACGTNPPVENVAGAATPAGQADDTLIVDCLLPGVVKKLGSAFTFLSPRRPIKASALECEIRGGEYVAFDRADLDTALKVWLPLAQQGDPQAQNYVGAIYEKGLGVPPDYAAAARWYQKAADQGHAEAQFALGHLYELGLGVPKNIQTAYHLYRQASGLPDAALPATELSLGVQQQVRLREALEQQQSQLSEVERQIAEKRQRLGAVATDLAQAERQLARRQQAVAQWDDKARQAAARYRSLQRALATTQTEAETLHQQLAAKRRALAETEQAIARQTASAAEPRNPNQGPDLAELRVLRDAAQQELAALRAQKAGLEADLARAAARHQDVTALQSRSGELERAIAAQQAALADTQKALARQSALAESRGRDLNRMLAEMRARKQALQASLAALEQEQAKIARRRQDMEQERRNLISALTAEQQKLVADLARQQAVIDQLKQTKHNNDERIAALEREKRQRQVAMIAPLIEILDPSLPAVRSTGAAAVPVLRLRSATAAREIVGKITAETGLLLVTLNDQTVAVSPSGVFKHPVTLRGGETLVDVVAVDREGNRAQKKFVLKAAAPAPAPAVSAPATPGPKIPDIDFGNYYALLIGNNNYEHLPDLVTPVRDVQAIKKVLLERYKFKNVITLTNATRYDIITQLNKLRRTLTEKDNLVIYYAGHGELDRVNMKGQWLPVDAESDNTANWISNSALTELVNAIPAKHVLVVADSCYSGIMTRSALTHLAVGQSEEARVTWIKKMVGKRSRTVLTSGGVAPVLDEGGGDHSIFARAFLQVLKENNGVLEGQGLFRRVSAAVAVAADRYQVDQVPEYAPIRHAGHESGDFFWVPRG